MRLLIISGRSGSGKSTALHVLEDVGFTCIDNLPASLLPHLLSQVNQGEAEESYAISIDARNSDSNLQDFPTVLSQIKHQGIDCELLFFDANDNELKKRFSETRRKHPLSSNTVELSEAIELETQLLQPISRLADLTIDTSSLNLHQLRDLVKSRTVGNNSPGMAILFQSFGFKHGPASDSDLIYDVRCLPNPHWIQALRSLTGQAPEVAEFLQQQPEVAEMIDDISRYLQRWLPRYAANNRSYITIGIGCTGGQHRSVYIAEQLHSHFKQEFENVQLRHREISR